MPRQDRTGTRYEKLLAFSLEKLGFSRNVSEGKNYIQPSKNSEIAIAGTYIQPDLVVRADLNVSAVLYSTHWSNARDSKRKFWRTWEEQAQQRCEIGDAFLSVNCIFEALPAGSDPIVIRTADELPVDTSRNRALPLQLEGWDPGIGWAMVESFDVSILFPKPYGPISEVNGFEEGDHDPLTTKLLERALKHAPKAYFATQWEEIRKIKKRAPKVRLGLRDTNSRFRIGLLHIYLLSRLYSKSSGNDLEISDLVEALSLLAITETPFPRLAKTVPFDKMPSDELDELLEALSKVYVRKGAKPKFFCTIRRFEGQKWVSFNPDLQICVGDLKKHKGDKPFFVAVERAFQRFDGLYGVSEAIDDLASIDVVDQKIAFVRDQLASVVEDPVKLQAALSKFQLPSNAGRSDVSAHQPNWHVELLLIMCNLNSAEDIQARFKAHFEESGHKLRPHAPYGGNATTIAFMIMGHDVCSQWSSRSKNRTLSETEFRELCWKAFALSVADAIESHGDEYDLLTDEVVRDNYLQAKSMRVISSDLNGFEVMVDHYLSDLCHLQFIDNEENPEAQEGLKERIRPSWQTDMVKALWGANPLETWLEAVSNDGAWVIKLQSAQDGNEGHKTKELAGRSRAMHLDWIADEAIDRDSWKYTERLMPKAALVLDGDWSQTRKKNLYEAGWDWVGDVSQLGKLRSLIQEGQSSD